MSIVRDPLEEYLLEKGFADIILGNLDDIPIGSERQKEVFNRLWMEMLPEVRKWVNLQNNPELTKKWKDIISSFITK